MKTNVDVLSKNIASLRNENIDLNETIIDLQARSMRDNLLFFNFDEGTSFEDRKSENCAEKVLQFCENNLKIDSAATHMKIDRAHRIGPYQHGKKRPIVVKFNFYGDKETVKSSAREKLINSNFRVCDQLPKPIQDRRKKLLPYLIEAKRNGKQANLSYDALYIDRVKYTHDRPPPGPVPELPPRGRREYGSQRPNSAGSNHDHERELP
jgi:hypothetical protein